MQIVTEPFAGTKFYSDCLLVIFISMTKHDGRSFEQCCIVVLLQCLCGRGTLMWSLNIFVSAQCGCPSSLLNACTYFYVQCAVNRALSSHGGT